MEQEVYYREYKVEKKGENRAERIWSYCDHLQPLNAQRETDEKQSDSVSMTPVPMGTQNNQLKACYYKSTSRSPPLHERWKNVGTKTQTSPWSSTERGISQTPVCYWLASIMLFPLKKPSGCMTWNTGLNTEIRETSQKIYREEQHPYNQHQPTALKTQMTQSAFVGYKI